MRYVSVIRRWERYVSAGDIKEGWRYRVNGRKPATELEQKIVRRAQWYWRQKPKTEHAEQLELFGHPLFVQSIGRNILKMMLPPGVHELH
jgi:hypothetical protein